MAYEGSGFSIEKFSELSILHKFVSVFTSEYGYKNFSHSPLTLHPISYGEYKVLAEDCFSYKEENNFAIKPTALREEVHKKSIDLEHFIEKHLEEKIRTIYSCIFEPTHPLHSPMDWGFCFFFLNLEQNKAVMIFASAMVG